MPTVLPMMIRESMHAQNFFLQKQTIAWVCHANQVAILTKSSNTDFNQYSTYGADSASLLALLQHNMHAIALPLVNYSTPDTILVGRLT